MLQSSGLGGNDGDRSCVLVARKHVWAHKPFVASMFGQ